MNTNRTCSTLVSARSILVMRNASGLGIAGEAEGQAIPLGTERRVRFRRALYAAATAACTLLVAVVVVIVLLSASGWWQLPVTLEPIGVTNVPFTASSPPLWTARNKRGIVSGLAPAFPSHLLFTLKNHTSRPLGFRPLLYEFTDSLPKGTALAKGPSRDRARVVDRSHPPRPNLYFSHGMMFGPPDCFTERTLEPGKRVVIALPRPPFDCVWRPSITYELTVAKSEILLQRLKSRFYKTAPWPVHTSGGRLVYEEFLFGAWITNAVFNK
jgi:hypothetical protein